MVSVIITTYKREPAMLLRALDSVLTQTYNDIEIIIVDDSPSDFPDRAKVREAVEKRKQEYSHIKISYIAHPENMGACVARNTGLFAAKGEYIGYLDDDDEWLPEKTAKQLAVMQQSSAALVYCGGLCIDDSTGISKNAKKEYVKGKALNRLLYSNFIESTSYPLIRKECIEAIGGFDPLMQSAQDYDVWLRLAEKYDIDYIPEPLVRYHIHNGERITSNPIKKINGLERINEKYAHYLAKDKKLWWKRHIVIARYYVFNLDVKKALSIWWECVCKCPEYICENINYLAGITQAIIQIKKQRNKDL